MKKIVYWYNGYQEAHGKAFEMDKEYEFIKARIRINKTISNVKLIVALSPVLDKSVKETKIWLDERDSNDLFDIKIEDVIGLNYTLGNQIEFEALTVEDGKKIKEQEKLEKERNNKRLEAWVWYDQLSDKEQKYVETIKGCMVAVG